MAYSYMSSSVSSSSSSSSSDGGVEQQQQQQQQGPQQQGLGYSHSNSNGNGNGLLDTLYSGLSLSAAAATTMTRRSPSPSPSPAYLPLHRTGTAGCTEHAVDVDADGDSNTNEHEHDEEDEMDRLIKSEKGAFIYGYTGAAYPQSQPARPHPHPQPPLCALIASLASLIPRSSSQRQGQAHQQPATAAAAAAVAASTGSGRSNDTRSSGGSSSSSSSRSSSACTPRKVFIHLLCLAVLALAIVGLGCIVAFATGLIQKTHVYSEKALQDSGWTRRPITIAAPAALPDKEDSAEPEHSRQAGQPQSQSQSQQRILGTPSSGVTIHDFTPSFPRNALPSNGNGTRPGPSGAAVSSHTPADRVPSNELHLLILCPLRNAAGDLAHFFRLLDTLMHPVSNTSLGFLVGDEDDDTGNVLHSLVRARMEDQPDPLKRYRHVSLLHRDFKVEMPSGSNRHSYVLQTQRRTVMARARTYLLTATLEPTVDWVLWLDSDISEFSPSLFQDLLIYGSAGVANAPAPAPLGNSNSNSNSQRGEPSVAEVDANAGPDAGWNDIIVPNAMKRRPDGSLLGFDMNNWAETPESLALRRTLDPSDLLIEGNIWQHMHRQHLADFYTSYLPADGSPYAPGSTGDVIRTESTAPDADAAVALATDAEEAEAPALGPQIFSSAFPPPPHDPRMNASHPAYIGAQMPLDGIGGVAALVRAEVHRMGATFPAWIFENQLETEAFGVLAKKLGARIVGLPNLFVLHKS